MWINLRELAGASVRREMGDEHAYMSVVMGLHQTVGKHRRDMEHAGGSGRKGAFSPRGRVASSSQQNVLTT